MVNLLDLHDIRVEEQDLSSDDLLIEADTNESLEIIARGVSGANADDQIIESVDEETMLAYEHEDPDGELFPEEVVENLNTDIHKTLRDMGIAAPTLKVPEGDEYQLVNDTSDAGNATVLYRQGRAQDVSPNEPGHPDNKTRTFVTTAETTQSIGANSTETVDLDTSAQPGILRDWPWEEEVPPNREYDLQALMFTLDGDSGSNITLDTFRLQSEEREFLAKDSAFVDVNLAQYPDVDLTRQPYVFPAQPTFEPGDNLDVQVEASNGGTSAEDAVVNATIVSYRRPV
jgi:hypothetical protein